jgi:hypothetical protein
MLVISKFKILSEGIYVGGVMESIHNDDDDRCLIGDFMFYISMSHLLITSMFLFLSYIDMNI